ncbi:MAG: trehalase family glycosidase [bacterium]|nr:trehalase family glycosidase [bacterium]
MFSNKELKEKAIAVLRENDIDGRRTKASPGLYPHQWLWDSCFIAIGYKHFDINRAMNEIRGLLEGQWTNGMVPHIIFNKREEGGHARKIWGTKMVPKCKNVETSGISQPPMIAIAVWEIYKKNKDKEFLIEVFPEIKKYHQYIKGFRELNRSGLACITHPWESGLDNSPRWDKILDSIRLTYTPKSKRTDTDFIPVEQRPTDQEYNKYWYLVSLFVDCNYDMTQIFKNDPFIVEAILFNSVWCEANHCMSEIAGEIEEENQIFEEWAEQTKNSINDNLYSKEDGLYYDFDVRNRGLIKEQTSASLLPLFANVPNQEMAQKIVEQYIKNPEKYWQNYPLPSASVDSLKFNPKGYWRGPVWVNMNWFIAKGLENYGYREDAYYLRKRTIELINKSGFREYFNPYTGEGYGADNFSWSAALILDMMSK